jgi:hypothetical protein
MRGMFSDKFSSFAEDTKIDMVAVGKALIDMLVVQPRSAVALSDFAAAFHRHCGRLCDVRGYDQSRLVRLLHLASHNVQVNNQRFTHKINLPICCQFISQFSHFSSLFLRI